MKNFLLGMSILVIGSILAGLFASTIQVIFLNKKINTFPKYHKYTYYMCTDWIDTELKEKCVQHSPISVYAKDRQASELKFYCLVGKAYEVRLSNVESNVSFDETVTSCDTKVTDYPQLSPTTTE